MHIGAETELLIEVHLFSCHEQENALNWPFTLFEKKKKRKEYVTNVCINLSKLYWILTNFHQKKKKKIVYHCRAPKNT